MNIEVKEEIRKWKFEIELDADELEVITNSLALNNDVMDVHILTYKAEVMYKKFRKICDNLNIKLETLEGYE